MFQRLGMSRLVGDGNVGLPLGVCLHGMFTNMVLELATVSRAEHSKNYLSLKLVA